MEEILKELDINPNTAHLFIHAYKSPNGIDISSCESYFENGLILNPSYHSILSTLMPIDNAEIITQFNPRGNHKVIVSVPYELDEMCLGSILLGSGDTGNQYQYYHLLDFLIDNQPNTNINIDNNFKYIPREFIVGIYIDDYINQDITPSFIPNPYFYKLSNQNKDALKEKLIALNNMSSLRFLTGYCLGIDEYNYSDEEIRKFLNIFNQYSKPSSNRYKILNHVVEEKIKLKQKQSEKSNSNKQKS